MGHPVNHHNNNLNRCDSFRLSVVAKSSLSANNSSEHLFIDANVPGVEAHVDRQRVWIVPGYIVPTLDNTMGSLSFGNCTACWLVCHNAVLQSEHLFLFHVRTDRLIGDVSLPIIIPKSSMTRTMMCGG